MDLVFDVMQLMLDKKIKEISTEEDRQDCEYIQSLLDCRPMFYHISYIRIAGILSFLGVEDINRIDDMYRMIHSKENEARYASVQINYANPNNKKTL